MTNMTFQSDGKTLAGWIAKPAGSQKAPAVIWNHGSDDDVSLPTELQKLYTDRGFVFFLPVRRYHRPSLKSGQTINERIAANPVPKAAWVALNEEENRDVMNALAWLKQQSYVDAKRIVISGVSFGGVQTLLAAEQGGFDAAIAFAPGAMSWGSGDTVINVRLVTAVAQRKTPMFILQAENDYSLGPTTVLTPPLVASSLLGKSKVYPPFGTLTPAMAMDPDEWHKWGHGKFATIGGDVWGPDVFAFIDKTFAQ